MPLNVSEPGAQTAATYEQWRASHVFHRQSEENGKPGKTQIVYSRVDAGSGLRKARLATPAPVTG
jgi:hypothetical protein